MFRLKHFLLLFLSIAFLNACQPEGEDSGETVNPLDKPGKVLMGEELIFELPELPFALKNQASVSFPEASLPVLDSMVALMSQDQGLRLTVTGIYDARENKPEGGPDLGMMRAVFIERFLAGLGMDTQRVELSSRMDDLAFDKDGKVNEGYRFHFYKDTVQVTQEFDRTVYFWAAEDLIRWDPELKEYCTSAQNYLQAHPEMMMVLTGHTDYNGNHLLGEMRAESLKEYFGRYGLDTSRVIIRSEGPDKPIAPNDTQENKAKNRRVEVSFVKE